MLYLIEKLVVIREKINLWQRASVGGGRHCLFELGIFVGFGLDIFKQLLYLIGI